MPSALPCMPPFLAAPAPSRHCALPAARCPAAPQCARRAEGRVGTFCSLPCAPSSSPYKSAPPAILPSHSSIACATLVTCLVSCRLMPQVRMARMKGATGRRAGADAPPVWVAVGAWCAVPARLPLEGALVLIILCVGSAQFHFRAFAASFCLRPCRMRAVVLPVAAYLAAAALLSLLAGAQPPATGQGTPVGAAACGGVDQPCCTEGAPCRDPASLCLPLLADSSKPWVGELLKCISTPAGACGQLGGPCAGSLGTWPPGAPPCPDNKRQCSEG